MYCEGKFHLLRSSQTQDITENMNIYFVILKTIQGVKIFHHNHAPAFYRARWLVKVTRHVKARDAKPRQREFPE